MKRLMKEKREMERNSNETYSASPTNPNDLYHWQAMVSGPEGSPYEGGLYQMDIHFPTEYPFKAPKVLFKTKIYHPNINSNGEICLEVLKSGWAPNITLANVLVQVSALLCEPNPKSPLVPEVAQVFESDRGLFEKNAKAWTEKYAF